MTKLEGQIPMPLAGHITRLLFAGWSRQQITNHLKIGMKKIRLTTQMLERKGIIKRTCKKPALYAKVIEGADTYIGSRPSALTPIQQLAIPHRLGAQFGVVEGSLNLQFKRGLNTKVVLGAYTIQATIHGKVSVWLKTGILSGNTRQEILTNASNTITGLVREFEVNNSVKLHFYKWYDGIEWVFPDEKLSLEMAEKLGFVREPKIIAQTKMVYDDSTHRGLAEWNTARGQPATAADTNLTKFEYLMFNTKNIQTILSAEPLLLEELKANREERAQYVKDYAAYSEQIQKHLRILDKIEKNLDKIAKR